MLLGNMWTSETFNSLSSHLFSFFWYFAPFLILSPSQMAYVAEATVEEMVTKLDPVRCLKVNSFFSFSTLANVTEA